MRAALKPLWRNIAGVTAIEYAAMTAIIAVAVVIGITMVGSQLSNTFGNVAASF